MTTWESVLSLYLHAQELLCKDAHNEAQHRNAYADKGHFKKAGLEGLVLCNACIVGKGGNYNDHHRKHAEDYQ